MHKLPDRLMLTLLVIFCFIFEGCNLNGALNFNKTWKNNDIDQKKREEIRKLNTQFFLGIKKNDASLISAVLSDTLNKVISSTIDSITNQVSRHFQVEGFSSLNDYNIVNTSAGATNNIQETDAQGNEYTITYAALNKDMYVSTFIVKDTVIDFLVTAIYGKYDGKWKMNIFRIGQYKAYGKYAMYYYQLARKDFSKSYIVSAVCDIAVANACMNPANNIIHYKKEAEYKTFVDSVFFKARTEYHFPMVLDGISTKPSLVDIYPQMRVEGYFPLVAYVSNVKLKDTTALKAEYEQVKTEVRHRFTGIGSGSKYTLYRAYNEKPDGSHPIPFYGFADVNDTSSGQ